MERPQLFEVAAVAVVVLGGFLRFYRSTALSMWLDEGFTVMYSRMPWDQVLGLRGAYDNHPPGYYVLVKAVSSFAPEPEAGRYLSVVAGTLTIAVLYLLASRLLGRPAALVAATVLAVSPLAIWYSQDARQYAVCALLVSAAYLALIAFHQTAHGRWALFYAVAVAAAVYVDYSAAYALVPLLLAYPIIVRRHHRAAIPLLAGTLVAIVAYLPWMTQLIATVQALGTTRSDYLKVDPAAIWQSALSIVGVAGQGVYFAGVRLSPWALWPSLDEAMALVVIVGLIIGTAALVRRPFALLIAGSLLVGTFVVAALSSLISPGFAPRTVSYAVLGWSIVLGAAAALRGLPGPSRTLGLVTVAVVLALSAANLRAIYLGGDKEHWRELAADVSSASAYAFPIVTYPTVVPTLLSIYQPAALPERVLALDDLPDLARVDAASKGADALWFAYYAISASGDVGQHLIDLGYQRVSHRTYPYSLELDLYVRSGTLLGRSLPIAPVGAPGWTSAPPTAAVTHVDPTTGSRTLTLSNAGSGMTSIVTDIKGSAGHLYTLRFEARSHLDSGNMRSFLLCTDGGGGLLQVAPDDFGATVLPDGGWHEIVVDALCPSGTTNVRLYLVNAGVGAIDLRNVALLELGPTNGP